MKSSLAPSNAVTTRDSKGLKFVSIVEDAYNKAALSEDEAQRVNDTSGLAELIGSFIAQNRMSNKYADQEVKSKYTYPKEYYKGSKPIHEQCKWFEKNLGLDIKPALDYAEHSLPDLKAFVPQDAPDVGWFAVVSDSGLVKLLPKIETIQGFDEQAIRYCLGINLLLDKIAATRPFYNWRNGQIVPKQLRLSERTTEACRLLAETQSGDVWLIAAQLGVRHRGRSTNRALECFVSNEYGCGSLIGSSIAATHPERFVRWKELDMNLPGDEFDDPVSGVRFGSSPYLGFSDDRLEFGAKRRGRADEDYGAVSFFLPQ